MDEAVTKQEWKSLASLSIETNQQYTEFVKQLTAELTAARACIKDLAAALKVALMNLDPCDMPDRDFDLIEAAIDKHKAEIDRANG